MPNTAPISRAFDGRTLSLWLGMLALTLTFVGCDTTTNGLKNPTVVDVASARSDLTVLAGVLQQTDLAEVLGQRDTSFTVFAPVNDAFEPIDTDRLSSSDDLMEALVSYHVVPGQKIVADSIDDGQVVETLDGDSLALHRSDATFRVNDDTITTTDLEAANGVVHLVDGVLLEGVNADHRMLLSPDHRLFSTLVADAGLSTLLAGVGPDNEDGLTVFAPTNEAILNAYDENGNGELDDGEGPENAEDLVEYHVVDDVYSSTDVPSSPTEVATLEGANVAIEHNNDQFTVNGAYVSKPDLQVENGFVHAIDTVLTPPGN